MAFTEIRSFQGGLADSDYKGMSGSFGTNSYGLDLHNASGLLQANWALTKSSGSTVTDLIIHTVASSDGSTYFAGDAGKIYKRTSGGTWSNVYTTGSSARICGFAEYNGYFFWATSTTLYRMAIGGDWATGITQYNGTTWTTSGTTWSGAYIDTSWHVMKQVGSSLYIGAGQYVTIVDSAFAVSTNGLDLPPGWVTVDIEPWNDNLLIGAYNTVNDTSALYIWDGYSESWSSQIPVPESRVYSIVSDGQIAYVKAGKSGNLYEFLGNMVQLVKQIPGTYTSAKTEIVNPDAMTLYNGKLLMGVSNDTSNPCLQGVYTFGSPNKDYQRVLDLSYILSTGSKATVSIGSIGVDNGTVFISWKDGSTYGVDVIDFTTRYNNANYETVVMGGNKPSANFKRVAVNFLPLPASCSVTVKYRTNGATSYTTLGTTSTTGKTNLLISTPINCETIQFQVVLGTSTSNTPQVNSINVEYDRPGTLS